MTRQHLYILGPSIDLIRHTAAEAGYALRDTRPITVPDHLRGIRDITVYIVHPKGLRESMLDAIIYHQQTGRITFNYGPLPHHDSPPADE